MSAKVPADLTDAFYALTLVFQETPIPDQTDRKPLIRRDVLIEQLDGYQIGEIRANQFIDWLVGVGVFEAHDPVLKEGETIEVDLSGAITLGEQDRGTKITPIRTLAIDRGAWERLQAGAMAAASEDTAG